MKKIILALFVMLGAAGVSFAQMQIITAASQKTIAGINGVAMKYTIVFQDKKNAAIEVDSVKSIADKSPMTFYVNKNEITFGFSLLPPEKCKTCVDTTPVQPNLTKGVVIYYKRGEKKSRCKVKKFMQLEDKLGP